MAANGNTGNVEPIVDPNDADPNDLEAVDDGANDASDDGQGDDAGAGNQPPPAPPRANDNDLTPRNDRERALMNRARSDEKQKLYRKDKELRDTIRSLTSRLDSMERNRATPSGNTGGNEPAPDASQSELMNMVRSLQDRLDNEARERKLGDYKRTVIEDLRRRGVPFVERLVTGDSEEEIDIMAELAVADAEYLISQHAGNNTTNDDEPVPATTGRRTVTRTGARQRPTGVPPMPTRNSRSGQSDDSDYSLQKISSIVRNGAGIRSGEYAKHRENIMRAIQNGNIR